MRSWRGSSSLTREAPPYAEATVTCTGVQPAWEKAAADARPVTAPSATHAFGKGPRDVATFNSQNTERASFGHVPAPHSLPFLRSAKHRT